MMHHSHQAQQILAAAEAEARRMSHPQLEPAHLLLGLTKVGSGAAYFVRRRLPTLSDVAIREAVQQRFEWGYGSPEQLPNAPATNEILEMAGQEARAVGSPWIASEHLLFAMLRARLGGVMAAIWADLQFDDEFERAAREWHVHLLASPGSVHGWNTSPINDTPPGED